MRDFWDKMRNAVRRFMYGRYGGDPLGITLVVVALLCSIVGPLARAQWLSVVSTVLAVLALLRMLSRDYEARRKENALFLEYTAKPRAWFRRQKIKWDNRATKAYVRCPHCHTEFALPKGKGKVRATCPKCGEKSEHTV